MKKLIEYYTKFLANEISNRMGSEKNIEPTMENILTYLHYLSKKEENIGDAKPWIPADIKRMLLFILFEGKAVIDTNIVEFESAKYATATTVITVEGNIIAKATRSICFDEVEPFAGYSDNKRNIIMKEYAMGSAETKALTKAGIAMDMTGDMKEYVHMGSIGEHSNDNSSSIGTFNAETAAAMEQIMNEDEKGKSNPNASEINTSESEISSDNTKSELEKVPDIILFGPQKGKKIADVPPKIIAWALACIDTKKSGPDYDGIEKVTELYREKLADIVMNNVSMQKIYDTYIKK